MSTIKTKDDVIKMVYASLHKVKSLITADNDKDIRRPDLTRLLLDKIGRPDSKAVNVLVTGSKGKGSTARMIAAILEGHGLKVGLFTSPHLIDFSERIRVNGIAIPDGDLLSLANMINPYVEGINADLKGKAYLGPMGVLLAIATSYFAQAKTDINVIECGRGGLFDDTNVVDNRYAVITRIMEEHVDKLGPTILDIADHKWGIVKSSTQEVLVGRQTDEVQAYLRNKPRGNKAYFLGEDFTVDDVKVSLAGTSFNINTAKTSYFNLQVPLLGNFQADNAALAVKTSESILGDQLDKQRVADMLSKLIWPGRIEIMQTNPTIILDGSINEVSAYYLAEIVQLLGCKNVISIIGVPVDKDYKGVIKVCSSFSNSLVITKTRAGIKEFPPDALGYAKNFIASSIEIPNLPAALDWAKSQTSVELILIIGTQTFIGEAMNLWGRSLNDLNINSTKKPL